jgi:hypothetical protein
MMVGFVGGDVQKELIVLHWNDVIVPENGVSVCSELNFDNAGFPDPETNLPVFYKSFTLENDGQDYIFSIENEIFEEIKLSTRFAGYSNIGDDIQIVSGKNRSNGQYKLHLQVSTIKKEGNKILRLKSFELKQIPIKATLKSGNAVSEAHVWKTNSVLKSGKWVKIGVTGKGVFKIPYSKLTALGFADPTKVNVFGSGGTILSEDPGKIEYDDLEQCAVWHDKNNGTDCLFFYSPGTVRWDFDEQKGIYKHTLNDYTNKGFFFLTNNVGNPKVAQRLSAIQEPATHSLTTADACQLYEIETENVLELGKGLGSGKHWFGERFKHSSVKNIDFDLTDIASSEQANLRVNAIGRSFASSQMKILVNQVERDSLNFNPVNTTSQTSSYADQKEKVIAATLPTAANKITLKYFAKGSGGKVDDNAFAWLDYIEVNYRRTLKFGNGALFFRDKSSLGNENIAAFSIENAATGSRVFDVTDVNNAMEVPLEISGNKAVFKRPANKLFEYVAFKPDGAYTEPEYLGEVENQDLHALGTPEFVIVTHPNFIASANKLAEFHRNYDGMSVEVVTTEKVYNEFSSGSKSATGIRNFIKMLYDRGGQLRYVLLFGDGSYDNRELNAATKNFVPTFQSDNSLVPVSSFVTDDYFVMLDAGESVYNGAIDLGIGRIPSQTTFEAETVINKIENYYKPEALGNWRNIVCFISDDEDGGLHMADTEKLDKLIKDAHSEFVTDKIYFDSYLQQVNAGVERYPDVTSAINNRVKEGVLILNYVGHANESYMADERVLDISDVGTWSNTYNLPIFVTATCEFSRFDADQMSIGENVLFNPIGGGIGLFSTTRLVYAYSNSLLSQSFYRVVFEKDEQGKRYRMGDIMRLAKINTLNSINKRNFSLLADPALRLSYPKNKVVTTSVNGVEVGNSTDTIRALQKVDIAGVISDFSDNKLTDFSGEMTVTVYDKETTVSTLGNNGETPFKYNVRENIIYKGQVSVENGDFAFSFVVPKDISYAIGQGNIMYYAQNKVVDAHGAFDDFVIGGLSNQSIQDNQGPKIELFMDNRDFVSGNKTSRNPTLEAYLSDETGINTAGTGIGHDITAVLNGNYANVMVLNNYYQADINNYKSGVVRFPFKNLPPGKHTITLKAWDVANNSSEQEIEFEVTGDFYISQVTNMPNPVVDNTFFSFEHNQPDANLTVIVEIYDIMGRRVDYIKTQAGSNGAKSNPIRWNFNETNTLLLNGVYIYRITAQNNEGAYFSKSGKMMISR